jgi:hypothetical protein
VEFLKKAASKTDGNNHSSTMNLYKEHDSCQTISIMLISIIWICTVMLYDLMYRNLVHIFQN